MFTLNISCRNCRFFAGQKISCNRAEFRSSSRKYRQNTSKRLFISLYRAFSFACWRRVDNQFHSDLEIRNIETITDLGTPLNGSTIHCIYWIIKENQEQKKKRTAPGTNNAEKPDNLHAHTIWTGESWSPNKWKRNKNEDENWTAFRQTHWNTTKTKRQQQQQRKTF